MRAGDYVFVHSAAGHCIGSARVVRGGASHVFVRMVSGSGGTRLVPADRLRPHPQSKGWGE